MPEQIEIILNSISNINLATTIRSQLMTDPRLAAKTLRKNFLFDEAIAITENFEIKPPYRKSKTSDFQRLLWNNDNLLLENEILDSPIIYSTELEAGISKPKLLRSANGAWFIWKHEQESDWAINNQSELATSVIDRQLNLQIVPYTFSFYFENKNGIRQFWIHNSEMAFLNFPKSVDMVSSAKIRLLDYFIFNRDRRSTNLLVDKTSTFNKKIYAIDHGGAFYNRKLQNGNFEKRPPEEVLSFVGCRSVDELLPTIELKEKIINLDPKMPFSGLEKYLSDFDISGICDRVTWLQNRI